MNPKRNLSLNRTVFNVIGAQHVPAKRRTSKSFQSLTNMRRAGYMPIEDPSPPKPDSTLHLSLPKETKN